MSGTGNLKGLLAPKSVALVGASEKKGFGYWTAYNLLKSKDHMRIYFVHPVRESVLGVPCHRSITELPETVDCVIIATRRDTVSGLLEEAGKKGIKNAIVFASGFSEEHTEEGRALEKELQAAAEKYGINVLGPNCMGLINNVDKINILGLETAADAFDRKPYIGVVAQSGAISQLFMKRPGFPVGYQITTGNSTVLAVEDFVEYMVDDEDIRVIAMYIEGVKKPDVLLRAFKKAAEKGKSIAAIKVGKSAIGAEAASSHTGSLAGSHSVFEATFKKYGVMEVDSMEELLCLSQALAAIHGNLPKCTGLASYNLSGGANILSADCAEKYGLELPKLQPETCAEMEKYIPSYATASNPLDATTDLFGQTDKIVGVLKALDSDPSVGAITITQDIANQATEIVQGMVDAVVQGRRQGVKKPIFFNCITEMDRSLEIRNELESAGVGLLSSMPVAYSCIKKIMDFAAYRPKEHYLAVPKGKTAGGRREKYALSEADSKKELVKYGVRVPKQMLARSCQDVSKCDIPFPWVMKIQSPNILHKTDLGCVKLNIEDISKAEEAYNEIIANAEKGMPEAVIEGVVIQEMAKKGLEFIVGVSNDSNMGPLVLVGMGGIFTEVFKDAAMWPAPINTKEAMDMLKSLKSYKLLQGYRGSEPADTEALADVIVKVSNYAYENEDEIKEMDVNPVIVYPKGQGVCAVDALIVKYKK